MLCICQGTQGLPGKPVSDFRLKHGAVTLLLLYLSGSEFVVCVMTDVDNGFSQQGEDGEPGYPGPQGPPGVKVCMQFVLIFVCFCFLLFFHSHLCLSHTDIG